MLYCGIVFQFISVYMVAQLAGGERVIFEQYSSDCSNGQTFAFPIDGHINAFTVTTAGAAPSTTLTGPGGMYIWFMVYVIWMLYSAVSKRIVNDIESLLIDAVVSEKSKLNLEIFSKQNQITLLIANLPVAGRHLWKLEMRWVQKMQFRVGYRCERHSC